jgi:hypothetical protein
MATRFHLIDLVTQCHAVERVLAGRSDAEIIAWLSQHGAVAPFSDTRQGPRARQVFLFRSAVGMEISFFLGEGCFVFVGDHTTFRPAGD